jgi:collagenase-like PrtC family protease
MNRIELLSPAKDLETGIAAINCGTDAVYLGAARFGAREAAGNPIAAIEELVRYAHKYWAKVYVTLNTLLYDEELGEAVRLATNLYQIGVDALIIQDTGLLELDLPPLPLFASTQMHNHSAERVAFLEKVGFQRVILARELTLEQIRAIRAATTVELETFVHGALCVSYSGQCYLSYAIGGRSGNRGQCAQPCRRSYSLVGRNGEAVIRNRYLLSLRDLNLSNALPDLLDAGVTSFKIEGRLKDKAYVMNVVGNYRKQLDDLLEGRQMRSASSGTVFFDFMPYPAKTFNRGFTTHFLYGRGAVVASHETPKSLGEPLGKVISVGKQYFSLGPDAPAVHPGDGLCFLNSGKELAGTIVNRVEGSLVFPANLEGLSAGVQVYRNHDHQFSQQLEKSRVERRIRLQFKLAARPDGISLLAVDEDGNEASFFLPEVYSAAQQESKALETIERQLRKLGGTGFECTQVNVDFSPVPFLPVSSLNSLRRGAVEALLAVRQQNLPPSLGGAIRNNIPYPEKRLAFGGNVLNQKAIQFYRRHGVETIEPAAETGLDLHGKKVMTTRYCLRYQLNACPKQPDSIKLPEPLHLVDDQGINFPLKFNCADCVMEVYFQNLSEK